MERILTPENFEEELQQELPGDEINYVAPRAGLEETAFVEVVRPEEEDWTVLSRFGMGPESRTTFELVDVESESDEEELEEIKEEPDDPETEEIAAENAQALREAKNEADAVSTVESRVETEVGVIAGDGLEISHGALTMILGRGED